MERINPYNDSMPLVSVCVTTFNRKGFLPLAVDTVMYQTYNNIEIIIVDDCSQDGTSDIVQKLMKNEKRIKYIRHEKNSGLAVARNSAIFNAKGKYITFLDDDDQWDKTFIEKFLQLAEQYDEQWCFCCGRKYSNDLGESIHHIPRFEGKLLEIIRQGFVPPPSAQFYPLVSVKSVGGYNEKIKSGVCHDLWLRLAFAGYNIKALQVSLSSINQDITLDRMTTVFDKRTEGINASLKIWHADISKYMGESFYQHFKTCYQFELGKNFIIQYLKQKKFYDSFLVFIKSPKKKLLICVGISIIFNKLCKKRKKFITSKPLFRTYKPT